MGLGFLAPLFLAGMGMIALPYWLHHIRRPEREPVVFSSLMFVPNIRKEVIERRRLQHLLLLLLRMLLLILLALAFSRPVWYSEPALAFEEGSQTHVILLDLSYSMADGERFDDGKEQARQLINDIASDDTFAILTFSDTSEVLFPLDGSVPPDSIDALLDTVTISNRTTRYTQALQKAVSLVPTVQLEEQGLILHVISDFQQTGMPALGDNWRLPSSVRLNLVDVGDDRGNDVALVDAFVDPLPTGEFFIRGLVQATPREADPSIQVTLVIDGEPVDTKSVRLNQRTSAPVQFQFTPPEKKSFYGWLQLADDSNPVNNRRTFAHYQPESQQVLLLTTDVQGDQIPGAWFLQRAIEADPDSSWQVTSREINEWERSDVEEAPSVIVLVDGAASQVGADFADQWNADETALLVFANETIVENQALIQSLGIGAEAVVSTDTQREPFAQLSWVNFKHPIFLPFQDSQYNDFSTLRFRQFVQLVNNETMNASVIARMDRESAPAMVVAQSSNGVEALVVAFSPTLEWSSLPKSPKFVALVQESLRFLGGTPAPVRDWIVGERVSPPEDSREWVLLGSEALGTTVLNDRIEEPGILRWQAGSFTRYEASNVAAIESSRARVSDDEFRERFLALDVMYSVSNAEDESSETAPERDEWMSLFIALLAVGVITETWYASRLTA